MALGTIPICSRLAGRFRSKTATVVYPGARLRSDWGWFAAGPARMHLRALDPYNREQVVWLESRGARVFEPDLGFPTDVAAALREAVLRDRLMIERAWAAHMILMGWLRVHGDGGSVIVQAYPGAATEFFRSIPVDDVAGHGLRLDHEHLGLDPKTSEIVIGTDRPAYDQIRVTLAGFLWRDPRRSRWP